MQSFSESISSYLEESELRTMPQAGDSGRYVHKAPHSQNSGSIELLFIQMSFDIFNFRLLCAFQDSEDKAVNVSNVAKGRLFQTVEGVILKVSLYGPNRKLVLILQLLDIFIFFMAIK